MAQFKFQSLEVWQLSIILTDKLLDIADRLSDMKKYRFAEQLNGAALSISNNIAEGSGRTSDKEFLHFLNIAISSSYELETQLLLCNEIFAIDVDFIIEKLHINQRMIGGLKRKINALK